MFFLFFCIRYEEKKMNRFKNITKPLMWFMALLLTAFMTGCGDGASSPILGGGGAGNVPHVAGDTTRPRVTVTFPVNLASAPDNTKITATFTEDMVSTCLLYTSPSPRD